MKNTETIKLALSNWRTAPVDEQHCATLEFLEKLTLHLSQMNAADIQRLRNLGITDEAIEEAIRVCFVFSIMDWLADSLDFYIPPNSKAAGRILFTMGYGIVSLPG